MLLLFNSYSSEVDNERLFACLNRLQLIRFLPSVGIEPGIASSAGQRFPIALPVLLFYRNVQYVDKVVG